MENKLIIKNYPNYVISNNGYVFNIKTNKKLVSRKTGSKHPQLAVTLHKSGVGKNYKVHRLVAEYFIPNPLNKPEVNHIDNNSFNNHVSNLEWVTGQENMKHAAVQGRLLRKFTKKTLLKVLKSKKSSLILSKELKISSSTIRKVRRGELHNSYLKK